jgi:hypothetical protein
MHRQLTEQEREAYTKIMAAIEAVITLTDRTVKSLPRDSEVSNDLAYCSFDVKNNVLGLMYTKLMNWEGRE